jgi:hypothetical protein
MRASATRLAKSANAIAVVLTVAASAWAQSDPAPTAALPANAAPQAQSMPAAQPTQSADEEKDPLAHLLKELESLRSELQATRVALAQANLESAQTKRDLEELRQYIADHREFGSDFSKYQAVKEQSRRDAEQKRLEEAKQKREVERTDREVRRKAAVAELARREAHNRKLAQYRRSGFSPVGLDVYASRWSYFYETTDTTRSRIDYQPGIGNYVRLYPGKEIDYSKMTISGSVLNASEEVRNIGVALTFFDENGNQVGQETVQVNNARPDVPYPFTSKIDMALNRAFASSSSYVLYADPVDVEDPAAASTTLSGALPATTQIAPATSPAGPDRAKK